ncbi:MAG: phosphoglucosamine mutase, partial [Clostridiales bacterium]|nr:phosphoglucosamine mutase [Clostridiales bacterium]
LVQEAVKAAELRLGSSGRVLLRKSGTEPVLRVMAEAEDAGQCEAAVDSIIEAIGLSRHMEEEKSA